MKSSFKLLSILILYLSFSPAINAQELPFYDFDQVDYYSIDISEKDISNIEYQRKKNSYEYKKISKKNALFLSILRNNYPETIEENFPEKLINYGFKKNDIDKKRYPEINTIFSEKPCNDDLGSFCIPTFRDVFIFRKKDKIVGIAKICYSCHLATIIGTEKSIRNFGSCGDFVKLEKIMGK
ncbi:hypothetical protein [Chryseobacterium turcicum]|uniref:DUF3365 domain-containing protein n=1 Tax=Chryseobacterium turcicum TaxID=2898076 RepID=A0A9Q3V0R9_9FLAO|nr:hypothetical protein [Chryseobacterium turcicum]MCD1116754.1 hypothetical protein [Chryseobacterium turcicum]